VRHYYGLPSALEPMFLYFTRPLIELGHQVQTFDHHETARRLGRLAATEALVDEIRRGCYDLVLYQTAGFEPVDTSAFVDLARTHLIVAWNSDDDWQWGETSKLASHFTFMVTTYPSVYRANRQAIPNLLLSQWGCLESREPTQPKSLDFSFAGAAYKSRNRDCRWLRARGGRGSPRRRLSRPGP